jgi:peptide/nickel transport system substrate-binding protein
MLLYRLAFALIIPPKYIERVGLDGFHRHPVGMGPFKFVQWFPKKEIILEKNEGYWRKGYPRVDKLVYVILPPERWIDALNTGEANVVPFLDGRHVRGVIQNKNLRVMKRKCIYTTIIMLQNRGPLQYKEVRQALNYALNKRDIVKYADYGNSIMGGYILIPFIKLKLIEVICVFSIACFLKEDPRSRRFIDLVVENFY